MCTTGWTFSDIVAPLYFFSSLLDGDHRPSTSGPNLLRIPMAGKVADWRNDSNFDTIQESLSLNSISPTHG